MIHPKAALIERLQKDGRGKPQFSTEREGPDHEPTFFARVKVQGQAFGEGRGGNKREAERRAAEEALVRLDREAAKAAAAAASTGSDRGGKRRGRKAIDETDAPVDDGADRRSGRAPSRRSRGPGRSSIASWPNRCASPTSAWTPTCAATRRSPASRPFAVRLYQDVLEQLGEVVEED